MDKTLFPVIDPKATGKTLKALLSEKGISVKELSRSLGLGSVQAVYKWLRGESIPGIDNLLALSALLETPVEQLLEIQ